MRTYLSYNDNRSATVSFIELIGCVNPIVPPAPSATLRLFLIQIAIGCIVRKSITASIQSRGMLISSTKTAEDSMGDRFHSVFIFYKDIHINF